MIMICYTSIPHLTHNVNGVVDTNAKRLVLNMAHINSYKFLMVWSSNPSANTQISNHDGHTTQMVQERAKELKSN